jgi:hypothetical protein
MELNEDGTLPTEQPQVTEATKFRRGGFKPAAEVIAEAGAAPQEAVSPQASEDPEMHAAIMADESVNIELGEGVSFEEPVPAEEIPVAAEAAPEIPAEEPKFKIGTREFTKQEEAWAYAEQLERERDAADAFRQGVEAASVANRGNPAPAAAAPAAPAEIDPEYYTNPQAYFAKMQAQIVAQAKNSVFEDQKRAESHKQVWTQFYTDYPDLTTAAELVELTRIQNWETLQHVETKQALKQLAEKTRAKLKPMIDARMPKTELPKVKTTASPGGAAQVTPAKSEPRTLNFTQQMKTLRKNRTQLR